MEPDPKMANTDDDNYMADVEIEANSAPTETAQQRFRLAGSTNTPPQKRVPATFVKYDHSGDSEMFDSVTARSRFFRPSDTPPDPPKFRRRRVPGPGRSPPVPVMSDWKVPPCISGWRKPSVCTIPLDKRLQASEDVRRRINDNLARLLESLRAAETKAVRMRSAGLRESRAELTERREREIRKLAAAALAERAARAAAAAPPAPPPVSAAEDTGAKLPAEAKHSVSEVCGADAEQQLKKVTKTDQGLSAGAPARAAGKRERPVELDEPEQSDDPFDLDQFMAKVKKKGKEH
ncbi:unnamed protein product [Alopecurus aequalis]